VKKEKEKHNDFSEDLKLTKKNEKKKKWFSVF